MHHLKITIIAIIFILVENNYQFGANAFDANAFHRRFQKDENIQKSHGQINNKEENHTPTSYPTGIHKRYDAVQNTEHYANDDATKYVSKRNIPTTESTSWQNSEYFRNNYQNSQFKYNYENNGMIHHKEESSFYTSPPSRLYLPSEYLEVPVIPAMVPVSVINKDKPPQLSISSDSNTDIKITSVDHKNNSESITTNNLNPNIQSTGGSTVDITGGNSGSEGKQGDRISIWQNSTGTYTVETIENGSQIVMILPKITTTSDQGATVVSIKNDASNSPEIKVPDPIREGQAGGGLGIWQNSTGTYTIESFGNGTQVVMLLGGTETNNSERRCKDHQHNIYDYVVHHYHHVVHLHYEPEFPHIDYYHQPKHNPTSDTTKPCLGNSEHNQNLCKHEFHDYKNYPYYPSYPGYPHYPTYPHHHGYSYNSPISFIYHR